MWTRLNCLSTGFVFGEYGEFRFDFACKESVMK
jgi:hypothetical protein